MASKSKNVKEPTRGARARLSRSLRKHIRLMKASGRREDAVALWRAARKAANI